MATFIESARTVKDIVDEIENIDRICDILRKLDMPTITVNGMQQPAASDIYREIERRLDRYKEILLETELHKK